ncbi:DNA-directed DNA/RNA polymerase mu-like isoform X2 [Tubulanus polymorphus]|uniref:DNA-directed DNA/RNA polymerase mu-like isoform X2 n=1 Tax=Tubulanus polymorphus TaxID=672921 RepID=UPI003DA24D1B
MTACEPRRQMSIYICPARIQNARLKMMKKAAKSKRFPVVDDFNENVTHIVTEFDTVAQLKRLLKLEDLPPDTYVVSSMWITDSLKNGSLLDVSQKYVVENDEKVIEEPIMTNQDTLELLERYAEYQDGPNDYQRALAFRGGSCVLKSLPYKVNSSCQLSNISDLGSHCQKVIEEILDESRSLEVERIRCSPWFQKMECFTSIFGVGGVTAKKWIDEGLNDISGVTDRLLKTGTNDSRKIYGLAFYEDLTTPVNRDEALALKDLVKTELVDLLPGALVELTGGFRRGKPCGHDVDILVSHPIEGKEQGVLVKLMNRLYEKDHVLMGKHETCSFREDKLKKDDKLTRRGQLDHFEKWIGIVKFNEKSTSSESPPAAKRPKKFNRGSPNGPKNSLDASDELAERNASGESLSDAIELSRSPRDWKAVRIDIVVAPYSQFYYAVVGWTGSKQFNRSLRLYAARELNMKLTSHGLYDISHDTVVPASTEEGVFHALKLQYRKPEERNC